MVTYHPNSQDYLPPPIFGRLTPWVHRNQIYIIIGSAFEIRRLSLWQEGGSRCEISLKFLNTGKQGEASVPFPVALGYVELPFASTSMLPRPGDIAKAIPRHLKDGGYS
jgi:hypothetical protein